MFEGLVNKGKQKATMGIIGAIISAIGAIGCLPIIIIILIVVVIIAPFVANDSSSGSSTASGGSCTYNVNGQTVNNLKVRLLKCEGYDPVDGEDLIDFETYILGVVYQEVGEIEYEAIKAQAIAARSFALTRPKEMGGGYGVKLEEEDGQWILSLRSCTNDQVFCHPDKGCWSMRTGGQTSNSNKADWPNCTVHSGYEFAFTGAWKREPLAADSKIRQAVSETVGQVFTDTNGNIVHTDFTNSNQTEWNRLAKEGKDALEILVADYGQGNISDANCETVTSDIDDVEVQSLINLSDEAAWNLIIGKSTTSLTPSISKSDMDSRVTTIDVKVRTYSGNGYETTEATKKITVNKAVANLYKAFFNDLYNEAPDFIIDQLYCYSYRKRTNGSSLSAHAYGTACDINWDTPGNGYGDHVYTKEEWSKLTSKSKYKVLYKDSPMHNVIKKYTLSWGGAWRSTTDAMHISFVGDETRAALQTKYK